ncbi:MAG: ABC transporter permease [Defluviitaleaceae bacterium]|nr:ABC transporter permease [Defluviitaleaceae bacterium]
MSSTKAIFKKQLKGSVKNPETLIQFMIYPVMALVMGVMTNIDFEGYYLPQEMIDAMMANMPNLATMMATMFAGMALIPTVAGIIAEDIEKKSLRFLVMAGVKPSAYLIGVGSVIFFVSALTTVAFGFIAGFGGMDFLIFSASMLAGVAASIVLGATIGILTKNQQAATALSMPIALVLGFGPMAAQFNDTAARVLHIFYTQQLNVVADNLNHPYLATTPIWQSFVIMGANILVVGVLFVVVFRRKGMGD